MDRSWSNSRWLGLIGVAMVVLGCSGGLMAQTPMGLPITVENTLGFDRTDEPVASGIPIPYAARVFYPNGQFRLVDDTGTPVPSQSKVLARWFGTRDDTSKPVKWALLEFPATVPGNSTRTYYVQPGPPASGQIYFRDLPSSVYVDTGPATFSLDKTAFSLFKHVTVGGNRVSAFVPPDGLDVHDVFNAPVAAVLDDTIVEEQGSVRTVVCQKGRLPDLGLHFTARYFFWTGQSRVKLDFRLENQGNYGELTYLGNSIDHAYFEDLSLSYSIRGNAGSIDTSAGPRHSGGGLYTLKQDFGGQHPQYDWLRGFRCEEKLWTRTVATSERYSGAIALNAFLGSVSVAVDRFWQNFPKAFVAQDSNLKISLFPAFGNGPEASGQYGTPSQPPTNPLSLDYYRFEGGRWKTHTMTVDFKGHGQQFSTLEIDRQAQTTNTPMMALAPRELYFKTFALGDLVMERRNWSDVGRQRYEAILDVLGHDSAAADLDSIGRIGLPKFVSRGGTYGNEQMYGWENFGDIAWGDGYSSNHYDLPYGVLVNFFRTGDYAFFDAGRDLCAHRRDYDNNHTTDPSSSRRGGQMYEKGYFHGNYRFPTPSHTWVHGPLLYYVMTGDEGSYETALQLGAFTVRNHPENWDGRWGSRILGWQLEALMNLWNYIGDTQYLSVAQQTMQRWEFHDLANGARGVVPNPNATPPVAATWMHAIVLNGLCKYYINTRDTSALPSIQRLADFMKDHVIEVRPSGPQTSRTLARVYGIADPAQNFYGQSSSHHVWVTAQALAFASICLQNVVYYQAASDLFESITRYYQETGSQPPQNYTNPGSFSDISFRMATFPNSETKIMGGIGLWGHAVVTAETLWGGEWFR